jgi:hypothetical protein
LSGRHTTRVRSVSYVRRRSGAPTRTRTDPHPIRTDPYPHRSVSAPIRIRTDPYPHRFRPAIDQLDGETGGLVPTSKTATKVSDLDVRIG